MGKETVEDVLADALTDDRYRKHVREYGCFDALGYHETWEYLRVMRMEWDDEQENPYFTRWDVMNGEQGERIYRYEIVSGPIQMDGVIGDYIPDPSCVSEQRLRCDLVEVTPDIVSDGIEEMYQAAVARRNRLDQISEYASELRDYLIEEQDTDPDEVKDMTTSDIVFRARPYGDVAETREALRDMVNPR